MISAINNGQVSKKPILKWVHLKQMHKPWWSIGIDLKSRILAIGLFDQH